jgi:small GTP-binding protein
LLEITGTINRSKDNHQVLDKLKVSLCLFFFFFFFLFSSSVFYVVLSFNGVLLLQIERERGITIKAQTASMVYVHNGKEYLLNLVDTPGHVDFSYEVSRSLAASQGALLLVDASQGVQAQTVANFFLAFENNLEVIPVLNKVDLQIANPEGAAEQLRTAFDLDVSDISKVSAKTGLGVSSILPKVIEKIPP